MAETEKPDKRNTNDDASVGDIFGALVVLAVLGFAIYMAVTDHWQWFPIITLGAAFVFGMIKFGWDLATAVENQAKRR